MAKPKPKKKGFQTASATDGMPISAALMAGAAVMVILAIFAMSLKSQLIKPGRIVSAAESAGLFDKLPRLMFGQVFGPKRLISPKKQLMLKEDEIQELAEAMFDPDWVAGEFEQIIWDASAAIKGGQPIVAELFLEDIKGDIANALIKVTQDHSDNLVKCGGAMKAGKSLCLPPDVSRGLFLNQMGPEIKKAIDAFPDRYPLLPKDTAAQISSATGIFGTLSALGIVFILLAIGMGVGAWKTFDEDGPPPAMAVGGGLAVGGLVLLVVVMVVKGGVSAATGALARSLEASYATVVDKFFSQVISGGFRFAMILAVVSLVAGVGLFFWGRQNA